jgi:O-methyltransferase
MSVLNDGGGYDAFLEVVFSHVRPYTMTSLERIQALGDAIGHVVRHAIPGDIVECGVWRGGSMMAAAKCLLKLREIRQLYLFDTFEGMPPPSEADVDCHGRPASTLLAISDRTTSDVWACSSIDEVRKNMNSTGYPEARVTYVQGRVEDTIPSQAPSSISVLRLDTDWYESTAHELHYLFPRLSAGGILIIDDYGHWQGARRAVDEYFATHNIPILLTRIDYTGRMGVKSVGGITSRHRSERRL